MLKISATQCRFFFPLHYISLRSVLLVAVCLISSDITLCLSLPCSRGIMASRTSPLPPLLGILRLTNLAPA